MATDLTRIGNRARMDRQVVFTNLYHHIYDVDNLRACYDSLAPGKATGEDGVSKKDYGQHLSENLESLSQRLRNMGYRPGFKRRSYIPKAGNPKGRPLGISNFEDKIVEEATKRALEPIYETMFEDSSYGYRPRLSAHKCLNALGRTIQQEKISFIVEADIRSFFDKVNHQCMIKFLRHRISDKRVIRLITRMLKSGILDEGLVKPTEEGTPQGSILSPLLSNVYLHYVLDLWFRCVYQKECRGVAHYFRYADDFLACFQYRGDAERFLRVLGERLHAFSLSLAPEKTQCIAFGRFARSDARRRGKKPEEFTFLGFTHYCGKTFKGHFKVKRRTNRTRMARKLREFAEWARGARVYLRKGAMIRSARRRLAGYLNYYAITDNLRKCGTFAYCATRILFKWLNRKSQRRAYTWESFNRVLKMVSWPKICIRHDLNPCRRAEAF